MGGTVELDELVEHWTLLGDEQELVAGKRGATRLGFALQLKFYARHGRFPSGRAEFPGEVVDFVARQVNVPASELGFMSGRSGRRGITRRRSTGIWGSGSVRSQTRRS